MSEDDREVLWLGSLTTPELLATDFAAQVTKVVDAAHTGDWDTVMTTLTLERHRMTPNVWRPGGSSGFTPLHQAAWHGADTDVVTRLLSAGAWKSLPALDGRTAADIAQEHGHTHLADLLAPPQPTPWSDPDLFDALDAQLDRLVQQAIRDYNVQGALRPLPTRVLLEVPAGQKLWFAIPGMYGGFAIELMRGYLFVESWSRVVGGSGQAHVVTPGGAILVEKGFV